MFILGRLIGYYISKTPGEYDLDLAEGLKAPHQQKLWILSDLRQGTFDCESSEALQPSLKQFTSQFVKKTYMKKKDSNYFYNVAGWVKILACHTASVRQKQKCKIDIGTLREP